MGTVPGHRGGTHVPYVTAPSRPGGDSVTAALRARYRGLLRGGWTRRAALASETALLLPSSRCPPPNRQRQRCARQPPRGVGRALLLPALSSHRWPIARPALSRALPLPAAGPGRGRRTLEIVTGRPGADVRRALPQAFPGPSLGCRCATDPEAAGAALSGLSPGGRSASNPAHLPAQPLSWPGRGGAGPRRDRAGVPAGSPWRNRAGVPAGSPWRGSRPARALPAPILRSRSHGPGLVRFRQCLRTMRPPHPGSRWGQHTRPRWRRAARRPSATRPKCARASCARCAWRISRRSGSSRRTTRSSTRAKTGTSGRNSEVRAAAVNAFGLAVGNPCSYLVCTQMPDNNKILIEGTYRRGMQFHSSVNLLGRSIVLTFSRYFP